VTGTIPETSTITTRQALSWITLEGARMLGQEREIGSLAPGKRADIVVLRPEINLWPVHDPVSTVVMQATTSNIEHVIVGAEFRKRDGKLLVGDLQAKRVALETSGRRIANELGLGAGLSGGHA
jgi:5-methylthioadenosine/S-adenosylhomocysteine deaminase